MPAKRAGAMRYEHVGVNTITLICTARTKLRRRNTTEYLVDYALGLGYSTMLRWVEPVVTSSKVVHAEPILLTA